MRGNFDHERMVRTVGITGARGRNRTGMTVVWSRDFKSLASTCFATRAFGNRLFIVLACPAGFSRNRQSGRKIGGWGRNRTGVHGFAGRCMTTLPPSRCNRMRDTQGALFYYHPRGIATLDLSTDRIAAMSAGPVRQQPPIRRAPDWNQALGSKPSLPCPAQRLPPATQVSPLLG